MEFQKDRINYIKNQKGFTLVELMVVLAILAILSSVAVFSLVGYLDKSRFDQNEQNAQSIYQAVQTSLGRKKNSGGIEEWIQTQLLTKGEADPYVLENHDEDAEKNILDDCYDEDVFESFPGQMHSVGDSVHMRYTLTYQKDGNGNGNKIISDLVGGYFYDTTILDATFTVEFDVEKKIAGDESVHYDVNTYAVFYDSKRNAWDNKVYQSESGQLTENHRVPTRDYAFRSGDSLVGYYNGGNPDAVDSVYTPVIDNRMEFVELALRNSEKLELSFSVKCGNQNITGTVDEEKPSNIHYTATIFDPYDDSKIADLVISEAYLTTGKPDGRKPVDYSSALFFNPDEKPIQNGDTSKVSVNGTEYPVLYAVDYLSDDTKAEFTQYKASLETTALVYVNKESGDFDYNALSHGKLSADTDFYRFPLTVSYVVKKYDSGARKEYVSYSIALDAMMSRQAEFDYEKDITAYKESNIKMLSSSFTRLFGKAEATNVVSSKSMAPRNFYVSMIASVDAFTDSLMADYNIAKDLPASDNIKAKRAYDDPVYFRGYVQKDVTGNSRECGYYVYTEDAAQNDADKGCAVCNSFFGDLGPGSYSKMFDTQTAVITSFRHLYNMRYTTAYPKEVDYVIRRDLNWYQKLGSGFTSEVEVYGFSGQKLVGFSPVGNGRGYATDLKVVNWPAMPVLAQNQTLRAAKNDISGATGDTTAVIRNVQMRRQSFVSTDEGYAFICKNEGNICNIRCENFCLTLESVADGGTEPSGKSVAETLARLFKHGDDSGDSFINIDDNTNYKLADNKQMKPYPMGGLIGVQNGMLGMDAPNTPKEENTIRMSNPIVLAGIWEGTNWKKIRMYIRKGVDDPDQPAGIGGVIGYYSKDAGSAGYIETDGDFAVAGAYYVGGVMGNVHGGVGACLCVDSGKETSGNVVVFPTDVDSLIMGRKYIGGAVGYVVEGYFAQVVPMTASDYRCDDEGIVSIKEQTDAEYGISVRLAKNSYIWQYGGHSDDVKDGKTGYEGTGGAVGHIYKYDQSKVLSIKSINEGYILSSNNNYGRYIGGAVGYIYQGSAREMYISARNTVDGRIGTKDTAIKRDNGNTVYGKSYSAAAGVACIKDFGKGSDIYVFDVRNEGALCCNTNKASSDVGIGSAIGAFVTTSNNPAYPSLYVRAENSGVINGEDYLDSQTEDKYWKGAQDYCYGVGGAIGYIYGLQNDSHIYSLMKKNAAVIANGNNVGGAVGCIRKEVKGAPGKTVSIIAGVCDNAQIKGKGINIGGSVGYLRAQAAYSKINTQVYGDTVICGHRNVGGVVGCGQQQGAAAGITMALQRVIPADEELKGSADVPTLSVKGCKDYTTVQADNKNIGGVVGVVGTYNGAYGVQIEMPTQNGSDQLVMNIAGGKYVAGMAGCFYMHDLKGAGQHNGTVAMTGNDKYTYAVALHPKTTISGIDLYVAGAIGYVYDDINAQSSSSDFAADVKVAIPGGNATQVITGTSYVGGAIGAVNAPNMTGSISSVIGADNAIIGKGYVGGAIGYTNIQTSAGIVSARISANHVISASQAYVGGGIGMVDGTAVYSRVAVEYDGTGITDMSAIDATNSYIGGSIGCIGSDQNGPIVQEASVSMTETGKLVTTPANSYTAIGGVVGWVRKGSKVENVNLSGGEVILDAPKTSSVGGMIGQITENSTVSNLTGTASIRINALNNVGGYIGTLTDSTMGKIAFSDTVLLNISGNQHVGGCIGEIKAGVVGTSGDSFKITGIQSVESVATGGRGERGTGGFVGAVYGGSKVNCSVDVTLKEGYYVKGGGWNIGGVFGRVENSNLYGNYTTHLAGGQVLGNYGHRGGVIGYIQKSDATGTISTYIDSEYVNDNEAGTPLGGATVLGDHKSIGGVIGHIGNFNDNGRNDIVHIGDLKLYLQYDLTIRSGFSSLGGVIGQCESANATIESIEIKSQREDGEKCCIRILPDTGRGRKTWDLGGIIGYMMGNLDGSITSKDTLYIVSGQEYVGGWIGCMDGRVGQDSSSRLEVNGIVSVTGSAGGVGGVIGVTGGNHTPGNINSTIIADLKGAVIKGGGNGVGGVIGQTGVKFPTQKINSFIQADLTGATITSSGNDVGGIIGKAGDSIVEGDASAMQSTMNVTMSGTTIEGARNVGGIIGYLDGGAAVSKGTTYTINMDGGVSSITANTEYAGGMIGCNYAKFIPDIAIKVSSGEFRVAAPNGHAGGIMGANAGSFGRAGSDSFDVQSGGGKIIVSGKKTGFILGYNNDKGKCGVFSESGGTLVYHIHNVQIDKDRCDMTKPRAGYVGENNKKGVIENVEIATDIEGFDDQAVTSEDDSAGEDFTEDSIDDGLDEMNPEEIEEYYPSLKTDEEMFEEDLPAEEEYPSTEGDEAEEPESLEDEEETPETESNGVDENVDDLDVPEKEDFEEDTSGEITEPAA